MSNVISPRYHIKLNSEFEELVKYDELEENKLILQQFDGEEGLVYICLNDLQVKLYIEDLKEVVDLLHNKYVKKNTIKTQ